MKTYYIKVYPLINGDEFAHTVVKAKNKDIAEQEAHEQFLDEYRWYYDLWESRNDHVNKYDYFDYTTIEIKPEHKKAFNLINCNYLHI